MPTGSRILIVDDDAELCKALTWLFQHAGYTSLCSGSSKDALDILRSEPFELVVLDLRLGTENGLDLLSQIKLVRPEISVIILTAFGTIQNAVQAMRLGADNFAVKPIDPPAFLSIVEKGLECHILRRKKEQFQRLTPDQPTIVAHSESMRNVLKQAEMVASRDISILFTGETGTGKGLLARYVHSLSNRASEPFVHLNCAGLHRELTESELFGYERGAFTGANQRKIGLFEAAHSGTLFLDEISEMDLAVQAKLLNVLEERRIRRLGGIAEIEVDIRLITATNQQLPELIRQGRFRNDLFYRLSIFTIHIPPLRDRRDDVIPLFLHLLHQFQGSRLYAAGLSEEARRILMNYDWPGNVRELRNTMENATILCPPGSDILPIHLPSLYILKSDSAILESEKDGRQPSLSALEVSEQRFLEDVLKTNNGNIRAAAQALGISRLTLYRKIKKYRIPIGSLRSHEN